jgi:hypothetical protein
MTVVALASSLLTQCPPASILGPVKAAATERDITPPVGIDITHPIRPSVGVHDPLRLHVLLMEDSAGTRIAIARFDLIGIGFELADELQETLGEKFGIDHLLINMSHPHSSQGLGPRSDDDTVHGRWTNSVHDKLADVLAEVTGSLEPVSLRAGRAPAQVGFNRRVMQEDGSVRMDPNRKGAVVPWVNVLVAERAATTGNEERGTGNPPPLAVVFEHPAHPVIVPDTSGLISADFPGAAVDRIRELLGDEVVPLFGQGCCGNINGYPLRTTHDNADAAGRMLGDAVVRAVRTSSPIETDRFEVRQAKHVEMPSAALSSIEAVEEARAAIAKMRDEHGPTKYVSVEGYRDMFARLETIEDMIERGIERGKPRRLDVTAIMLGREWILVALPHEMFCEYELWVDENAPFEHNMTFSYTNGGEGYIAVDEDLKLRGKGGYEAGNLPLWWANGSLSDFFGPPEVGVEAIIKDTIGSLWK